MDRHGCGTGDRWRGEHPAIGIARPGGRRIAPIVGYRLCGLALAVFVAGVAACGTSSGSSGPALRPGSASPGSPPQPMASSEATSETTRVLREIELDRLRLLVAGDAAEAADLHADDFQLIPPPGYPMGKEDYLDAVDKGELDYIAFEPISDIEVRVDGTTAVLWYESRLALDAAGIGRLSHDAWHLYYYEKRGDHWQVVREHATAVGGFPPPAG